MPGTYLDQLVRACAILLCGEDGEEPDGDVASDEVVERFEEVIVARHGVHAEDEHRTRDRLSGLDDDRDHRSLPHGVGPPLRAVEALGERAEVVDEDGLALQASLLERPRPLLTAVFLQRSQTGSGCARRHGRLGAQRPKVHRGRRAAGAGRERGGRRGSVRSGGAELDHRFWHQEGVSVRDAGGAATAQADVLVRRGPVSGADFALCRLVLDLFDGVEQDKGQVVGVVGEGTESRVGKVFDRPGETRRLDQVAHGSKSTSGDHRSS